jgi:hypothetical protein
MPKKLLYALPLVFALGFATAANAASVPGGAPAPIAIPENVLNVHVCHAICQLGPAGWHYHVGPRCTRIPCAVSPGGPYIWRCDRGRCGWWHPVFFRWY